MDQAQALAAFIQSLVEAIAGVSIVTMAVSIGVTNFLKGMIKKSWVIAITAVVLGFFSGLVVMKGYNTLIHASDQSFWQPLSVLIGFIAALGGPGLFSVTKNIKQAIVAPKEQ